MENDLKVLSSEALCSKLRDFGIDAASIDQLRGEDKVYSKVMCQKTFHFHRA